MFSVHHSSTRLNNSCSSSWSSSDDTSMYIDRKFVVYVYTVFNTIFRLFSPSCFLIPIHCLASTQTSALPIFPRMIPLCTLFVNYLILYVHYLILFLDILLHHVLCAPFLDAPQQLLQQQLVFLG